MNVNNSKMNSSEQHVTAISEDKVLNTVISVICNIASKIANYIDNFEGIMRDCGDDTACIAINNNYFTDIAQFYIGRFKSDIIDVCNMNKPQCELINIELIDDVVLLKVKV